MFSYTQKAKLLPAEDSVLVSCDIKQGCSIPSYPGQLP